MENIHMDTCEILIVEDDSTTRDGWERDIVDFNNTSPRPFDIKATYAETKAEAIRSLRLLKIHGAIVDLRIPDGECEQGGDASRGNDVLQLLLLECGVPTYVYSGFHLEASEQVKASNIQIIQKRGGASSEILQDLASQASLIRAMASTRATIAKELSRLFNDSIWKRWQTRWSTFADVETITGIVSRQTAAHISESLASSPAKLHPDEFYVVPALNAGRLDTGDLFRIEDTCYVVLTPRCNMANKMPSHVLVAVCVNVEKWPTWKEAILNGNRDKRERAQKEIGDHATQGHEIASHFLPPLDGNGPWLVNFKEARTFPEKEFGALLTARFASISPQFVPNLVQRYSAYLGRIGQPDIGAQEIIDMCTQ